MELNWLEDIDVSEISYVDRPAIDKRFIAIKRLEKEEQSPKDSAKTQKTFLEKVKDSFTGQKSGRVLNKANEDRLSQVAEMLKSASETIVAVLSTVNKSNKEDSMEKEELKAIIDEVLSEKFDNLKAEFESKFVVKDTEEEKQEEEKKEEVVEEEKKETNQEKPENEEMKKLSETMETIVSEIKSIKEEMHQKPASDKENVNNGEKQEQKAADDFTGAFGLKSIF